PNSINFDIDSESNGMLALCWNR
ncbi:unnamed protein product, partial [Allacma fusca]